jgi:hypothetical protein
MGGFDKNGNSVDGMEVFDSITKKVTKVFDEQNNWVKVPIAVTGDAYRVCAVPMVDNNAFILSGGR